MEEIITLNLFPTLGPQHPIKLHINPTDTLGTLRRILSHKLKLGIHDEIVLVKNGIKLDLTHDKKTIKLLDINDGDSLAIGLFTSSLPLELSSIAKAQNVQIEDAALKKCFEHARNYSDVEVAGVLIGREEKKEKILIVDATRIAEGDPESVNLDPIKIASVAERVRGAQDYIVGWYHSHRKLGSSMSGIDARLQSGYQQLYANAVAMILDPVKEAVEYYRVNVTQHSEIIGSQILNLPEPKLVQMGTDSITLTTILKEKEEIAITAFSGTDSTCGDQTIFKITVKNVGTVLLSKARIIVHLTSPDGKEPVSVASDDINLSPGDSKTYTLQCQIPASWSSGSAMVRAGVRNVVARNWLCPLTTTSITLLQPPKYEAKLVVRRTSQKVSKGETATYIMQIKNNGNRRDNIEINWDLSQLPKSWRAKIYDGRTEKTSPFTIELEAGGIHRLLLEVIPPSTGYTESEASVKVEARSLSSNPEKTS